MKEIERKPKRNLIRRAEVKRRTGDPSDATIWRWEKRGEFPQRVQMSPGCVAWFEDEIDAWVAARIRGMKAPVRQLVDGKAPAAARRSRAAADVAE